MLDVNVDRLGFYDSEGQQRLNALGTCPPFVPGFFDKARSVSLHDLPKTKSPGQTIRKRHGQA